MAGSRKHSIGSASSLSEPSPGVKRRRTSSSSLSDEAESSDEDKPLATKLSGPGTSTKTRPGESDQRSGKTTSALGVAHIVPKAEDDSSAARPLKVKIGEVKLNDQQIDRLTSGVTVDTTSAVDEARSCRLMFSCRASYSQ